MEKLVSLFHVLLAHSSEGSAHSMGLIRLLIFALAIWLVWRLYRIHILKAQRSREQSRLDNGKMVQCKVCGVHLPEYSAVSDDDEHWFCSHKHLQQYRSDSENL